MERLDKAFSPAVVEIRRHATVSNGSRLIHAWNAFTLMRQDGWGHPGPRIDGGTLITGQTEFTKPGTTWPHVPCGSSTKWFNFPQSIFLIELNGRRTGVLLMILRLLSNWITTPKSLETEWSGSNYSRAMCLIQSFKCLSNTMGIGIWGGGDFWRKLEMNEQIGGCSIRVWRKQTHSSLRIESTGIPSLIAAARSRTHHPKINNLAESNGSAPRLWLIDA